jgi:hypothetical protein
MAVLSMYLRITIEAVPMFPFFKMAQYRYFF